jgi:hypothetical protein
MAAGRFHEDLSQHGEIKGATERSFGVVIAVFFTIVGIIPWYWGGPPRLWALILSAMFAGVAWLRPSLLYHLNRLWSGVGFWLGRIVNPVVLGIMFYLVFTPMALLLRWLGKDLLRLKFRSSDESYWLPRQPPGPPPDTMRHQF